MKKPIIVLGIGELGSVFARAFLKNNHPVYPITRATDINELRSLIDPEFILVCTFFFSNHTEITVGLIKLCVAQSRGNNSFCIIATRSFHALGIDFRADCNSPSPVQTKINSD
jgi:hypothetical protein